MIFMQIILYRKKFIFFIEVENKHFNISKWCKKINDLINKTDNFIKNQPQDLSTITEYPNVINKRVKLMNITNIWNIETSNSIDTIVNENQNVQQNELKK